MKSFQKFAAVHANRRNHSDTERHLSRELSSAVTPR